MPTTDVVEEKLERFTKSVIVLAASMVFLISFWGGRLSNQPIIEEYKKQSKLYEEVIAEYSRMNRLLKNQNDLLIEQNACQKELLKVQNGY